MNMQATVYLESGMQGCLRAVRERATAVVVDALRASTTIPLLFAHGAKRVLVVATVEDAREVASKMPDALLVGERGGERLPGFYLGNSPLEVLAAPRMDGRTVIFTSSNGAQRLSACLGARHTFVAAPCNATALMLHLRAAGDALAKPMVLISAGQFPDEQYMSPEDEVSCAYLATRCGFPIADESTVGFSYWERAMIVHGLKAIFLSSPHAQRLQKINYSDDVLFCARPDTTSALPEVTGQVLLHGRLVGVELRLVE